MHCNLQSQLCIALAVCSMLLATSVPTAVAAPAANAASERNKCVWLTTAHPKEVFPILPGSGWDNLRNMEMSQVADISFDNCQLSSDSQYIVPNYVRIKPELNSKLDVIATIVDKIQDYISTTSASINLERKATVQEVTVEGKFSSEFSMINNKRSSHRTKMARTNMRHHLYSVRLQPGFELTEVLILRLKQIFQFLAADDLDNARYHSDLIVRDYGTHLIMTVKTGAVLQQVDFLKVDEGKSTKGISLSVKIGASASFAEKFASKSEFSVDHTRKAVDEYRKSVESSSVESFGGQPFGPGMNMSYWMTSLPHHQVAIDRGGVPLADVISSGSVPGLDDAGVQRLAAEVEAAVSRYYLANTRRGCTDPTSSNFDPAANVEAGCERVSTKFTFGGAFQTCAESRPELGLNTCGSWSHRHLLTGEYSCPKHFEKVKLLSTNADTKCKSHGWAWWVTQQCSTARLHSFWCKPKPGVTLPPNAGAAYGGSFSQISNNPITQGKSCPPRYHPVSVGTKITLCISGDHAQIEKQYPVAGFFSCKHANPLANNGGSRCPKGFTQSTIGIVNSCEIMQCTIKMAGSHRNIPLQRPPFERAPKPPKVSEATLRAARAEASRVSSDAADEAEQDSIVDVSAKVAAIGAGGVAAVALVVLAGGLAVYAASRHDLVGRLRRWRAASKGEYRQIDPDSLLAHADCNAEGADYGTVPSGDEAEAEERK